MESGPVIWVEGIIGAGKSTLADLLGERLGLHVFKEPVDSNPYLKRFYDDPKRWAYPMQIHLLKERYLIQQLATYSAMTGRGAILDRGLPGDRVFAKMHMLAGNIHQLEWNTYQNFFELMCLSVKTPSLILFLDVEPEGALERVKARAREAEVSIDLKYLQDLRKGYLDLLCEIETGEHSWSRGMETKRIPWNVDHQPIDPLVNFLVDRFKIQIPDAVHSKL